MWNGHPKNTFILKKYYFLWKETPSKICDEKMTCEIFPQVNQSHDFYILNLYVNQTTALELLTLYIYNGDASCWCTIRQRTKPVLFYDKQIGQSLIDKVRSSVCSLCYWIYHLGLIVTLLKIPRYLALSWMAYHFRYEKRSTICTDEDVALYKCYVLFRKWRFLVA